MSDFWTTHIFVKTDGREVKVTWDYTNRFPTDAEKQSTFDHIARVEGRK